MGIPCMNCHADVDPGEAKIYAAVYVCSSCFFIAERFEERIMKELKGLMLVAKESIRIALVKGELVLGKADPMRDLSKKEVLEQMLKMMEAKDVHSNRATAQRGNTPQQPATVPSATQPVRQPGTGGGART